MGNTNWTLWVYKTMNKDRRLGGHGMEGGSERRLWREVNILEMQWMKLSKNNVYLKVVFVPGLKFYGTQLKTTSVYWISYSWETYGICILWHIIVFSQENTCLYTIKLWNPKLPTWDIFQMHELQSMILIQSQLPMNRKDKSRSSLGHTSS